MAQAERIAAAVHEHVAGVGAPTVAQLARAAEDAGLARAQRSFFCFSDPASSGGTLALPELRTPCLGPTSFSIWTWIRLDPCRPLQGQPQSICMLHGGGMSLEVFVPDSGLLCVRVASPVGCCAALQASAPLITGCWHLLMLDMGAPSRWLLPFARAGAIGMLRVYLDGAIEISGALDFPAPTAALRHCHMGSRSPEERLHGSMGELLLLPCLTPPGIATDAAHVLRFEPRITLHEAAHRCGLRPTLSLHPTRADDISPFLGLHHDTAPSGRGVALTEQPS